MSSKILDDMHDVMRRRHYSIRTEKSYCGWVKRFVLHFNMKSRNDLTEGEKKGTQATTERENQRRTGGHKGQDSRCLDSG